MFEGNPVRSQAALEANSNMSGAESLSSTRQTRDDFLSRPFSVGEITSKGDLYVQVESWLASILNNSGVPDVDQLLNKSLGALDFSKDDESIASDLNRIVSNLLRETTDEAPASVPPVILREPLSPSQSETGVSENKSASPFVLEPSMRVVETAVEVLPETVVETPVTPTSFKSKVESLNKETEFNHDTFLDLLSSISTESASRYNEVVDKARSSLTRFNGVYAPGTAEKNALQLLSSIQGQSARMGVMRAEVVNSLNRTDSHLEPDLIKKLALQYAESSDKLMNNVGRLEELLSEAASEDTPLFSENYRQEMDLIHKEAKSVLKNISTGHPLYDDFKEIVEKDLGELRNFLEQTKSDNSQFVDSLEAYVARRDNIKAAVAYMKAEDDYSEYLAVLKPKINQFLNELEKVDIHTIEAVDTKNALVKNLNDLKVYSADETVFLTSLSLGAAGLQSVGGVLSRRLEKIKNEFGGIREVYPTLVLTDSATLSEEKSSSPTEKYYALAKATEAVIKEGEFKPLAVFEKIDSSSKQVRKETSADFGLNERHKNIMSRFPKHSFSKVAALISALVFTPSPGVKTDAYTLSSMNPTFSVESIADNIPLDSFSVEEYLRQSQQTVKVIETEPLTPWNINANTPPTFSDKIDDLKFNEDIEKTVLTEILPGVIFPEAENANVRPQPQRLKIFSDKADSVQGESLQFNLSNAEKIPDLRLKPYTIQIGDNFWDINEGQTIAGKLPVMSQINPYFRNALISSLVKKLEKNHILKEEVGGSGETMNDLIPGQTMNLERLNELLTEIAINQGYLM